MKLYLVRHGEANTANVDPQRGLSEAGRAEVERMAKYLQKSGVSVSRIYHSGKARAMQTAQILASRIAPSIEPQTSDGLNPNDPVDPIVYDAASFTEDTMLVGHLPFMDLLASRLVAGGEDAASFTFHPATVLCLELSSGSWSVAWMVSPANL